MQSIPHPNDAPDEIMIGQLVSEIFMFENVDARMDARTDARTDAGSSPIL